MSNGETNLATSQVQTSWCTKLPERHTNWCLNYLSIIFFLTSWLPFNQWNLSIAHFINTSYISSFSVSFYWIAMSCWHSNIYFIYNNCGTALSWVLHGADTSNFVQNQYIWKQHSKILIFPMFRYVTELVEKLKDQNLWHRERERKRERNENHSQFRIWNSRKFIHKIICPTIFLFTYNLFNQMLTIF